MKKVRIAAVAGVATLSLAVPAVAQTPPLEVTVTGTVKAAKGKAATKKKPKNATVRFSFTANAESKKTASTLVLRYPETIKLSGKGFPTCDIQTVADDPAGCPKGSQIGQGSASASLNGVTDLDFETRVYVNGANEVALYLRETGELGFQFAFPGVISKASKPYGQQVRISIPPAVQFPAQGLEAYITGVDATIGGKFTKGKGKRKKTYFAASLTGCPADKTHDFGLDITYVPNTAGGGGTATDFSDEAPCKK